MNEEHDDFIRILCKTIGISERMIFPERYMNDEEKQKYIEGYNNWLKSLFEKGE